MYTILDGIAATLSNPSNWGLFFTNVSVFFFAYTYMQPDKAWKETFKKTTPRELSWRTIAYFKDHSDEEITEESMKNHPDWLITLSGCKKDLTVPEYQEYLAYEEYDESYEIKYANEQRNRWAAIYGALLLITGSLCSLYASCNNCVVAILTLCIYIGLAVFALKFFGWLVKPYTQVKQHPAKPIFLDGEK